MNPMMDVQCTTFMANLRRYLEKTAEVRLHTLTTTCPTCRMFKYEEDTLVLQRSPLNDEEREHSALEKLRDIQHKQERLAEKVENTSTRTRYGEGTPPVAELGTVRHRATKEYDTNLDMRRDGVPRIAMWHVDGEASR